MVSLFNIHFPLKSTTSTSSKLQTFPPLTRVSPSSTNFQLPSRLSLGAKNSFLFASLFFEGGGGAGGRSTFNVAGGIRFRGLAFFGLRRNVILELLATDISGVVLLWRAGLGDGGGESSRSMISLLLWILEVILPERELDLTPKLAFKDSLKELPIFGCDENTSSAPETGDEEVMSIVTCAVLLSLWEVGIMGEKSNLRFTRSGDGGGDGLLE